MDVVENRLGSVTVLQVQGKLDSTTAPELERHLAGAAGGQGPQVVIDGSRLEYVSSAGLRVFLAAAKRLAAAGGKFAIACPQPQVRQILDVAGFSSLLPVLPTVDEAVSTCMT